MNAPNIARLDLAKGRDKKPASPSESPAPLAAVADGAQGRDAEIAAAIVGAVRTLNEAMDDAVKAGLIVEPTFSVAQGRFEDFGISADSFIANVKVFRKLC